ncbi:hypothetical protein LOTGIDRAFT_155626 [Lottia gigantea]|uniref:Uncharacterized protein n=1 Tax=Lottia gigantea TaxID=225164 RepID=V3ZET5_LOTGI|nr:hypothetical protein LOTGIDRAFT_155626 [Lottia gigantea]ESO82612.1 hypothetical protein LOTGIDRAFT_155626 [Lottia gigantea]
MEIILMFKVSLCEVESFLPTMEAVFETCPLVTNVALKDDPDCVPSVQDEHDSIIAKEETHANKTVKRKLVVEESVEHNKIKKKKARNGRENPKTWNQNVNKQIREKGKTYRGKKKNKGDVE